MKIYVFTEAYVATEEYIDVFQTKVFLNKEDAVEHLKKEIGSVLNNPEDGDRWECISKSDEYFLAVFDCCEDEIVMTISEHEI